MERSDSSSPGRERRRYARIPIKLDALISLSGRPPIACTVTDFCVAGMFIQVDQRQLRFVQTQAQATLYFALMVAGAREDLQLALTVCRVIGTGLGVAFQNPDPQSIALLQTLATPPAARVEAMSETQQRFAPEFGRIIPELSEIVERVAQQLTADFLRLAGDALFLAARDAKNNREQMKFNDAQSQLRRRGDDVRKQVPALLAKAVAILGNPLESKTPEELSTLSSLSLVDKDEFEEFLTVSEVVSELEARFKDPLYALDRRFSKLAKRDIDEASNPIGPTVVCNAFAESLKGFLSDRDASEVTYKSLRRAVEPQLERLYDEVNTLLAKHGILPQIEREKPEIKRTPTSAAALRKTNPPLSPLETTATGLRATDPGLGYHGAVQAGRSAAGVPGHGSAERAVQAAPPAMPPGLFAGPDGTGHVMPAGGAQAYHGAVSAAAPVMPGSGFGLDATFGGFGFGPAVSAMPSLQQAYSTAQAQLALRRQLMPEQAAVSGPRGGTYSLGQIADGLTGFQRALASDREPELFGVDYVKERIVEALAAQGIEAKDIGQAEGDAIEVIVNLFQALFQDTLLADFAKGQLKRLQPSVHKTALIDQEFFASTQHPIRQLLNRIALLRPEPGAGGEAMAARVQALVDGVNLGFERDLGVIEPVVRELDTILKEQRYAYESNVQQVVVGCEDQQRVLRERREKGGAVVGETTGQHDLPPEWNRWLNRSKALRTGERLVMNANTKKPYPVTLVWIGDDFNPYVFVDDRGHKTSTLTLQQVAMYLRRGVMKPVTEEGDGAVDRALFGVVNRLHEQVAEQATHDTLTGLLNRKMFTQSLEQRLPQQGDQNPGAVLCLLSAENLKTINEQYGVEVGDKLIQDVSKLMREHFKRKQVTLGRLGGTEWGLFWDRGGLPAAYKETQSLIERLGKAEIDHGGQMLQPRFVAGITAVEDDLARSDQLIAAAAEACNTARSLPDKPIYIAGTDNRHRKHLEQMMNYVAKAIKRDRLVLLYQEVRGVTKQAAAAAQIVVSAEDRNGKLVPPTLFSQAAAASDHAFDVDLWAFRKTLEWMARHEDDVERFSAFIIPLSRAAIDNEGLASTIVNELMQTSVPPAKICFEIADTDAVAKLAEAVELINTLREFGCQFILGEFGGGQTNYEYVKELAVDFVTIQSSFVADARQSPKDMAMARSINELVHFMGKMTIAKQTPEAQILELLRDIGVDFVHDSTKSTRLIT